MGMIVIKTDGSFGQSEVVFRAIEHGHMKKSINLDHKLQGEGCIPEICWTK